MDLLELSKNVVKEAINELKDLNNKSFVYAGDSLFNEHSHK